jgi:sulfate transport system substrate-binding protein
MPTFRSRLLDAAPLVFFLGLLAYVLAPLVPFGRPKSPSRSLVVYGFSILGDCFTHDLFPAFNAQRTDPVEFISSFGGSGIITNQILMGVPADMAVLSLDLEAEHLAAAGLTAPNSWRRLPYGGIVNRTPFIILVRPGNPKGIHDFADLMKPGVGIVHPDPLTSGGAMWALLAEYGSAARTAAMGGADAAAQREAGRQQLRGIWHNVVAQASSGRGARTQFENGFGDALVTYEQEALIDRSRGRLHADVVYPRSTVLSEHTLVVLDRNVTADERPAVDAVTAFLWTERAQRVFVADGFRSVDEQLNGSFEKISHPFLVQDFGGWDAVERDVVNGIWRQQVLPELGR